MRTEVSISICCDDEVVRCYRSARLRDINNYCGAVAPTIEIPMNDFVRNAASIIEEALQFCENSWADVPNAELADSDNFLMLRSKCLVINFSRPSTKKGQGIYAFAWGIENESRVTLQEPLSAAVLDATIRSFIDKKFGSNSFYSVRS